MKLLHRVIGLLIVCFGAGFIQPATAQLLSKDPFITTHADRTHYEPGGRYYLFGPARGAVTNRTGSINVIQDYTHQVGYLQVQQASIRGTIGYETRFSNHGYKVHAPFNNVAAKSDSQEKGNIDQGFTVYRLDWAGVELHPADGYDGPRGGGYPKPKGARDIYSYTVKGLARSVKFHHVDTRNINERFRDNHANLGSNFRERSEAAHRKVFESNPTHSRWGNAMEVINGAYSGVLNPIQSVSEFAGVGDVIDGAVYASNLAFMHSIAPLSPKNKLNAIGALGSGTEIVGNARDKWDKWLKENPNIAETIEAAANTAIAAKASQIAKSSKTRKSNPNRGERADVSDDFADAYYTKKKVAEESAALKRIANNQKNTSDLSNKSPGSVVREQTNRRIDSVLSDARRGKETKGRTTQYEKSGGFDKAISDFDSLKPQNVQNRGNNTITGDLSDGRKANVRSQSKDGRPTLEIQHGNKQTKIRYEE